MVVKFDALKKLMVHSALRDLSPDDLGAMIRDYLRTYPGDADKIAQAIEAAQEAVTT